MRAPIEKGYVTNGLFWLVQIPDEGSRFGFYLADEDQTWDGGVGSGMSEWTLYYEARVPPEVRAALGWRLSQE